ncbi:MAG: glycosyltransferase family 2 protein [Caldilineae bacterium]|nr:MAG: glycosyltransferase family 2 protein [Caldilineae bacterium]
MDIFIILLNWNAAEDTIACVKQFDDWRQVRPTIWVVDNASADGSVEAIRRACPHVHLIRNEANLGFAGGTNRGIEAALQAGEAPLLLLNNDATLAEADALRLLETLQADETIGVAGPLLFDANPDGRLLAAGGRNPVLHHHSHIRQWTPGPPVRPVEYVPGTVMLVRPEVFRQVGLLDEAYFFAAEVADLCRRAWEHGFRCVVDARARAHHRVSRSAAFRSTLYPYYIIRNRFLYIRKFYRLLPRLALTAVWGTYSLALSAKLRLAGQPATARAVWLGLVDGLQGRFGGQNERVRD